MSGITYDSGSDSSYSQEEVNLEDQLQQAKQKIINLEKELAEKATPFGENLEIIKQLDCQSLERLFPQQFNNYTKQQIQNATNYQQLVNIRQDFIHKQLRQNQDNSITNSQPQLIQPAKQERIIWI